MKYLRHAKILELIDKYDIETQEELAEKLKEAGMDVTQATISRDIKELKLIKVMTKDEHYRYATISYAEGAVQNRLLKVFAQSFVNCDYANNIVVIKTLPGMAQASASALDSMKWPNVLGTIAGDDTIMAVCRTEKTAEDLVDELNKIVSREKEKEKD